MLRVTLARLVLALGTVDEGKGLRNVGACVVFGCSIGMRLPVRSGKPEELKQRNGFISNTFIGS